MAIGVQDIGVYSPTIGVYSPATAFPWPSSLIELGQQGGGQYVARPSVIGGSQLRPNRKPAQPISPYVSNEEAVIAAIRNGQMPFGPETRRQLKTILAWSFPSNTVTGSQMR